MDTFRIVTDSCCDLPAELAQALGLITVPLTLCYQGQIYDNGAVSSHDFYEALRQGAEASTAGVNPSAWQRYLEPVLKNGQDALILTFSSALSATCHSACIAAQELREQFPARKIFIVDTLCASLGQGLLCYHAAKLQKNGASLEEVRDFAENRKLTVNHWFTVDDLHFLKRGGRISAMAAAVGSVLHIKPVLRVDPEGRLTAVCKVRGRKAAVQTLAEQIGKLCPEPAQTMFISHADCPEEAEHLASLLKQQYHVPQIIIGDVGAVVGSHAGPGTLALFFFGVKR